MGFVFNRAAGLEPLVVLSEAPKRVQARPPDALGWGWYPPTDYAAQTEYARRLAEHYAGKIDMWELQNEPDQALHPPKGEAAAALYAREALALAEGIRAAQPKGRILLGGGVDDGHRSGKSGSSIRSWRSRA